MHTSESPPMTLISTTFSPTPVLSCLPHTSRIVFWQYYLKGGMKVVEFLLHIRVVDYNDSDEHIMELKSITEKELPRSAQNKLQEMTAVNRKAQRGKIDCEMKVKDFRFGTSSLTFVGTLDVDEPDETSTAAANPKIQGMKNAALAILRHDSANKIGTPATNRGSAKGDVKTILSSIQGILNEVKDYFQKPDIFDLRKKEHFVENVMPSAPPLTEGEERLAAKLKGMEDSLNQRGERIKGNLKEEIDKFLWNADGSEWGGCRMVIDKSAKHFLAELVELDTFKRSRLHKEKNGNLPRVVRAVNSSRSCKYRVGMHFPGLYENRLFDTWYLWKEIRPKNGMKSFMALFVPLSEYGGTGFGDPPFNFTKAESTGVHIITELAPNVCTYTKIESNDLKMNLPRQLLEKLAKVRLKEANRMQDNFRRNSNKVDAEVRGALVEKMKDVTMLEEPQNEIFQELEHMFELEDGWQPLESPNPDITMKINYQQQKEGERSVAIGMAEGTADCSAEVAVAWYVEFCSRERRAANFGSQNPARFELHHKKKCFNEKVFVSVGRLPFPLNKREFVSKIIWKTNKDKSISAGGWPVNDVVDYGVSLGKLVRGESAALMNAKNLESIGGVPQCKITLWQKVDAGGEAGRDLKLTSIQNTNPTVRSFL